MKKRICIIFTIVMLLSMTMLTACGGGAISTKCYWCGKEEECYQYCLQYLDGYNPNGSFKYGYTIKYMSEKCASECKNSGQYLNVERAK